MKRKKLSLKLSQVSSFAFFKPLFVEIEEHYESVDVTLEGKLVNKYSLWTLKKLNPHHKTFLYALLKIGKISDRRTALSIVNEVVSMNNKWEKD